MKYVSFSVLIAAVAVFSCILTAQALQCYSCTALRSNNNTCAMGNLTDASLTKCANGTTACVAYETGSSIVRDCAPRNQTCTQLNATSHQVKHCRSCSTDKCNKGSIPNAAPFYTASYSIAFGACIFSVVISKLY